MTNEITIENENTFRATLVQGFNVFVGAGFSVLAKNVDGLAMPVGSMLADEIRLRFAVTGMESLNLSQLCAVIESTQRDQLYAFFRRRFEVHTFDEAYKALDNLNIKSLFTTNVDDLLFKTFQASSRHYLRDVMRQGPAFRDRRAIDFIALHGSITHEGEPLAFNPLDLANSFSSDPDKWHFLTGRLQQFPTLFWGYSLADAGILQSLNPQTIRGRSLQPKWIVLRERDPASEKYFQALGFQIIIADTVGFLAWLGHAAKLVGPQPSAVPPSSQDEFDSESLPEPASVPVRPLQDFYSGAPPTWYDIYAGRIYKTSQFNHVLDVVNSGRSGIMIGMAASGKTTVMMQVAAQIQTNRLKLVVGSMSRAQSELLLNRLAGRAALIFMDDAADDINGFNTLLNASHVQVVGFERDYFFELVSHLVDRQRCVIEDISELTEVDIQAIYDRIPSDVRRGQFVRPEFEKNASLSIYEVVEANTTQPTLKVRFKSVLQQLKDSEEVMHDVLVMSCYLHVCRVPVSYDTVSAFLRQHAMQPSAILDILDRLGHMIAEYAGSFADQHQDYFVPRSMIMSDAIISQVPSSDFRRVFETFHHEVSPIRITGFDIFRRRAFDSSWATRAYSSWKDGKEFYDRMMLRDNSPYILQQEALFLAQRHRFKEAFAIIDQAVQQSKGKNPTIRHSHAIILFQANINSVNSDDPIVVETLTGC